MKSYFHKYYFMYRKICAKKIVPGQFAKLVV